MAAAKKHDPETHKLLQDLVVILTEQEDSDQEKQYRMFKR